MMVSSHSVIPQGVPCACADPMLVSADQRQAFARALLPALRIAGATVLRLRAAECDVWTKADASPVTEADLASQSILTAALSVLRPEWPIIGEEDAQTAPETEPPVFVLVDPLDGTRDYIAGRDEFSINIALIECGVPTVGLIYAPSTGQCFIGVAPGLASIETVDGTFNLNALHQGAHLGLRVVVSRSHADRATAALTQNLGCKTPQPMGSALKFTMLASGRSDLYLRLAPTRGWDTAAGHALVEATGGVVLGQAGTPLRYSVRQGLNNNAFIAARTTSLGKQALQAWQAII